MTLKFIEVATYTGTGTKQNYEVQVGTYDEYEYIVYYYLYGTAVDRTYHSNVKSAIETAQDFINRNGDGNSSSTNRS